MNREKPVMSIDAATPVLPRRQWLQAAGAALLGARALAAPAASLREKAKTNLKLGIVTQIYARLPLEEAARKIRADGFTAVLTNYVFADVRFDPLKPDFNAAEKITACFQRHDIKIAAMHGYYNVVDPDVARRQKGEAAMQCLIANWKRLGCANVSTETGTFSAKSQWLESPENRTEAAFLQCRAALEKMAKAAEKTGAIVSIEPYWRNVIDSIERAERLFREVDSPALQLVMDPCNYFRKDELPQMQPMLQAMFQRLGKRIVVAHAKDVKAAAEGTELPAAGKGVLDYPLYLRLLAGLDREMPLLLEHLTASDVPRARDYVLAQFEKI